MTDNPSNPSPNEGKIYKEEEFDLMIELIENGLWRNINLVKALHVAESTIIEWKKRPEAQNAHRKAILKYIKRRTDAEKVLKELDMETDTDVNSLTQINIYSNLNDGQLDALIQSKLKQVGANTASLGEGKTDEGTTT